MLERENHGKDFMLPWLGLLDHLDDLIDENDRINKHPKHIRRKTLIKKNGDKN